MQGTQSHSPESKTLPLRLLGRAWPVSVHPTPTQGPRCLVSPSRPHSSPSAQKPGPGHREASFINSAFTY